MTKTTHFTIGQAVRNFGQEATTISFHSETGDLILQDRDGLRWIADPAKCEGLTESVRHREGLIAIG